MIKSQLNTDKYRTVCNHIEAGAHTRGNKTIEQSVLLCEEKQKANYQNKDNLPSLAISYLKYSQQALYIISICNNHRLFIAHL